MQRSLLLFLHVSAAMGIIAAFGVEGVMIVQLRHDAAAARTVLRNYRYAQRVGAASLILAVVTGVYLASAYWGWRGAWMGVGFLTLVAIAVIGATLTGVPVARAMRSGSESAPTPAYLGFPGKLALSFAIRIALFFGIVFLMTVKPAAPVPALLTILVAAVTGIVIGLPARRRASSAPNERSAMAR